MTANLLAGKKIVVMGVANQKSIAWGCAQAIEALGGQAILTYQNDRMKQSLNRFVDDDMLLFECDVAEDDNVEATFAAIHEKVGNIDGVVHAIAYADRDTLQNGVVNTKKAGFNLAQDISAYSLISVTRAASKIMNETGSIVTMTYMGSTYAITNYNMMGIAKASLESEMRYLAVEMGKQNVRVNAVSAGAVRTLAVTGVKGHGELLKTSESLTTDGKSVTKAEIGNTVAFLLSDLASGITGDVIYADKGVHLFNT
ncbi:Enoyl-, acyl-carrier-protein reductase, NADH [Fructilactobacillus florum 8D]|uniref:Enoyl-[acyl-carrier-protein] reductase [NADH] n=2 Tax=Fructilactobacillus florum TaxID=640331 RepID=W9EE55_9LACO|nr:enoyl-ACP reductase FabI [Fructilactobacillus florum]EKK20382.1 Enoyl-, acyl-carrier-protein reductase, NADH [Fructilactobacillus florum 2F]ETO40372.1 Enoyl-, acyl-carrier-protein reductase, NADH [Fructilactobacillus florum 8D]